MTDAVDAHHRPGGALSGHAEAISRAYEGVRRDPRDPYRHDGLTRALLAAGTRLDEAEASARTALTLDPDDAGLRVSYALVLNRLGHRDLALRALLDALLLDPGHAGARQELAALDDHRSPVPSRLVLALSVVALLALVAGTVLLLRGVTVTGVLMVVVAAYAGFLGARRAGGFF